MKNKKTLGLIICIVLAIAIVCIVEFGGGDEDVIEIGKNGDKCVYIEVIQEDKSSNTYKCHTDADNLEDLLLSTDFVEGEMAQYGLYIKKVEGVEADYDKNQAYWAMKKDGVDLMTGAHDTPIENGDHFELVYTK